MHWMRVTAICVLMAIAVSGPSDAFELSRVTTNSGTRILVLSGEFDDGDSVDVLKAAVADFNPAYVSFDSGGGNVVKAMEIGRAIRSLRLPTIQIRSTLCASACSLAFLGGVDRSAEPGSIGVHQSSFSGDIIDSHMAVAAVQVLTGEVIGYMAEMGADPRLLQLALATGNDDMRYLTAKEMADLRVTTVAPVPVAGAALPAPATSAQPKSAAEQQPDAPRQPATPEDKSLAFLLDYLAAWSNVNSRSLAALETMYAPTVNFYDKTVPRLSVMDDKRKFADRWPMRAYAARPGTIEVNCHGTGCDIAATVDWFARSPQRGATSVGVATFNLTVVSGEQIVSESGKVLSNDRKTFSPTNLIERWYRENDACRGGSGDDTSTWKACSRRDYLGHLINNVGWCYGHKGDYGYQMQWHECGSHSLHSGD